MVWAVPGARVDLAVVVSTEIARRRPAVWVVTVVTVVMELLAALVVWVVLRVWVGCWCSSVTTAAVVWAGPAAMVGGPVRRVTVETARLATVIPGLVVRGVLVGMRVSPVPVVLAGPRAVGVGAGPGRSGWPGRRCRGLRVTAVMVARAGLRQPGVTPVVLAVLVVMAVSWGMAAMAVPVVQVGSVGMVVRVVAVAVAVPCLVMVVVVVLVVLVAGELRPVPAATAVLVVPVVMRARPVTVAMPGRVARVGAGCPGLMGWVRAVRVVRERRRGPAATAVSVVPGGG